MCGGFSWQGVEVWFVAIWTKIWSTSPKCNSKSHLKNDGKRKTMLSFWVSVTFQGQNLRLNFGICRSNNAPSYLYPYGMPILNKIKVPRLILYPVLHVLKKSDENVARWAPTRCKWSCNLYKWPDFTRGITPISGLLTLLLAARGPFCWKSTQILAFRWWFGTCWKQVLMFTPIFLGDSILICAMFFLSGLGTNRWPNSAASQLWVAPQD